MTNFVKIPDDAVITDLHGSDDWCYFDTGNREAADSNRYAFMAWRIYAHREKGLYANTALLVSSHQDKLVAAIIAAGEFITDNGHLFARVETIESMLESEIAECYGDEKELKREILSKLRHAAGAIRRHVDRGTVHEWIFCR